ncbi:MAG: hypothetical protein VKJ64_12965 [Leptolyngbyaceae bacterium]|nr:hypothetical protein [Leptolyngbyaceae bacterium]
MDYEDLVTIRAFLTALQQQEQPLPDEVWEEWEAIAPHHPGSISRMPIMP